MEIFEAMQEARPLGGEAGGGGAPEGGSSLRGWARHGGEMAHTRGGDMART